MKKFFQILWAVLLIYVLAMAQIAVSALLPPPWSHVNVIFVFLIIILVVRHTRSVVWIAFGSFLIMERYATTPFGIVFVSAAISILCTVWLYQDIFTNRSWYAAVILSLINVSINRFLYTALIFSFRIIGIRAPVWNWQILVSAYAWEAILTGLTVATAYWVLARTLPSLRSADMRA